MGNSKLEQEINASEESRRFFSQEDLILDVTEAIWEQLDRREWNKKKLAKKLGRSQAYVTQLLNGSRNMTLRTLSDVVFALDLKINIRLCNKVDIGDWIEGDNVTAYAGLVKHPHFIYPSANVNEWHEWETLQVANG